MAESDHPSTETGEPMTIEDTLYARRLFNAPVDQLTVKPEGEEAEPPAPRHADEDVDPWTEGP
jgi:hypothetical protein